MRGAHLNIKSHKQSRNLVRTIHEMSNQKNIILDRFSYQDAHQFISVFKEEKYNTKIVVIADNKKSKLPPYEGIEIYGDAEIASGNFSQDESWLIDSRFLQELSIHEGLFINVVSRFALKSGAWTTREISDHFIELANFWANRIQKNNINYCVSFYTPHDPSSLSLYIVCKILRIPHVYLDIVHVAQKIRFISCSISERNLLLRCGCEKTPEWAKELISRYISQIRKDFNQAQPFFMSRIKQNIQVPSQSSNNSWNLLRKIEHFIKKKNIVERLVDEILPPAPLFAKISREDARGRTDPGGLKSRMNWLIQRVLRNYEIRRLRNKYLQLALHPQSLPSIGRYIYFPLPLEPEGSTYPGATYARSAIIAIKRLIAKLPEGCSIIIKSNPIQFSPAIAPYSVFPPWHAADYYDSIKEMGRIHFARIDHDQANLIDNSIGIACINGTAAIEAVARGKHAIIFSQMWYDSLHGIHLCVTESDIEQAIAAMTNGSVPVPNTNEIKMCESIIFNQQIHFEDNVPPAIQEAVASAFISALNIFDGLDERKWAV